jgi:hypothetical protein
LTARIKPPPTTGPADERPSLPANNGERRTALPCSRLDLGRDGADAIISYITQAITSIDQPAR